MDGRSDRTIASGASETVKASFSSANLAGDFTKTVSVTTNDPQHQRETLTCKGRVLVPFKTTPRFANFQVTDAATPLPQTIVIQRGDGGPLQLEVMQGGVPGIETKLREIRPGEHYELVVGIDPPQTPGKLRSWVKLKTGLAELPETTIPVYADIPPSWGEPGAVAVQPTPQPARIRSASAPRRNGAQGDPVP
ncbi:MAG: DUF1573 domain-containing protein [Planctomycetota bacterium]